MTAAQLTALKSLIAAHPELTAPPASDSDVADALNALTVPSSRGFYIQSRTILAVTGPAVHKNLLATIRSLYPDLVTILEQVGPNDGSAGGMDVNRADVQAFLASMINPQIGLTQAHVDAIVGLSKINVSMAAAAGLPVVSHNDVARANGTATVIFS